MCRQPTLEINDIANQAFFMGQGLLNPPTVEGWHEGVEWINSGALVDRVNFVARWLGDTSNPGVQAIIDRLATMDGGVLAPQDLVDGCLEMLGPLHVSGENARDALLQVASEDGDVNLADRQPGDDAEERVAQMLRLASSSSAYQFA